ncbi:EXS family protein [Giardia muris]|uniref:EXS family protein n=1 Tax=Giardia muris TaxID=5742 RepID=A0A4Z1T2U5_GIAMU|nr:EXS family protein [Giardia muris]|eukprot:TNJ26741.1 EXS family protein [Giardia muris]
MRFGESLKGVSIPEWREKYVPYEELKADLERKVQDLVSYQEAVPDCTVEALRERSEGHSEMFLHAVEAAIRMVNDFYSMQLGRLKEELQWSVTAPLQTLRAQTKQKKLARHNICEIYRTTELLRDYVATNELACIKITKKHDKRLGMSTPRMGSVKDLLARASFPGHKDLTAFQEEIEDLYLRYFSEENPHKSAKKSLLEYFKTIDTNARRKREYAFFQAGCYLLLCLFCFLAIVDYVTQLYFLEKGSLKLTDLESRLIRFHAGIYIYTLCTAISYQIYEKKRINYILVLELPPAALASGIGVVTIKSMFLMLILSFFTAMGTISAAYRTNMAIPDFSSLSLPLPGGIYLTELAHLINPLIWLFVPFFYYILWLVRVLSCRQRHSLGLHWLIVLWRCFMAVAHRVTFPLFFAMDQGTSCTSMIGDFFYIVSAGYLPDYVIVVFILVPSVIRAIQCHKRWKEANAYYPNVHNMAKYLLSLPGCFLTVSAITRISPLRYVLIAIRISEVIYKMYWDTFEDWALFTGGAGGKSFRRKEGENDEAGGHKEKQGPCAILRRPSCFTRGTLWAFFIINVLIRAYSVVVLFFSNSWFSISSSMLELVRRSFWNVFRLDNQQATNCEEYIAACIIPILAPQHERAHRANQPTQDALVEEA